MTDRLLQYFTENNLCIAVSGKSGCGNTTTSGLLAEKLGVPLINYTFRSLAAERGVSLDEIIAQAAQSDEIDRIIDRRQVEMASKQSCVLASRLAIWMMKDAFLKVYLYADPEVRSRRIHRREGGELAEVVAHTASRDAADHNRYRKLYGIDNDDQSAADLVLDAGTDNPEGLVEQIMAELESRLGMI